MKTICWEFGGHGILIALLVGLVFSAGRSCRTETDCEYRGTCGNCVTYQEMFALQEEAKVNLAAIYTAELSYFSNSNTYAPTFDQINWAPDSGYRYAYFLPDQEIQPEGAEPYQLPAGLAPLIAEVSFMAYAVSNIDCDAVMDVWMVHDARAIENLVNDALE